MRRYECTFVPCVNVGIQQKITNVKAEWRTQTTGGLVHNCAFYFSAQIHKLAVSNRNNITESVFQVLFGIMTGGLLERKSKCVYIIFFRKHYHNLSYPNDCSSNWPWWANHKRIDVPWPKCFFHWFSNKLVLIVANYELFQVIFLTKDRKELVQRITDGQLQCSDLPRYAPQGFKSVSSRISNSSDYVFVCLTIICGYPLILSTRECTFSLLKVGLWKKNNPFI